MLCFIKSLCTDCYVSAYVQRKAYILWKVAECVSFLMYHLFQFTSIPLILPDVAYLQHFSLMQPLWGRLCQQSNKKEWDRGRLVCVSTWKLLCLQLTVKGLDQHWVSHFSSIWSKWCSKPRVSLWEGVARPHLHNEKYKISTSIAKMQLYRENFSRYIYRYRYWIFFDENCTTNSLLAS